MAPAGRGHGACQRVYTALLKKAPLAYDRRPVPCTEPARPPLCQRIGARPMSRKKVTEAHRHCTGQENTDEALRVLDEASIDLTRTSGV